MQQTTQTTNPARQTPEERIEAIARELDGEIPYNTKELAEALKPIPEDEALAQDLFNQVRQDLMEIISADCNTMRGYEDHPSVQEFAAIAIHNANARKAATDSIGSLPNRFVCEKQANPLEAASLQDGYWARQQKKYS